MNKQPEHVFLVGGAVRDKLLNLPVNDKDYVVVGSTPAHMLSLGYKSVGKDFPVFLHPQTKEEYALARTERKTGTGYTGFSVDAGEKVTLEEDLARRDLSINAMAMNAQGELIDPYGGAQDLKNKILRHTTNAFTEDPVRVLRLARFFARFGQQWSIHPSTQKLVTQMINTGELHHLVPERIFKETEKALGERQPQLYFEALHLLGALPILFKELADMQGVPQSAEHPPQGDMFVHTMLMLKRAAALNYDLPTRFAALTHNFGKATAYPQRSNLHEHEETGVAVIENFCERLRIPNKLRDIAKITSVNHLHCHRIFDLKPKALQKLIIENCNALKQPERFMQFLQACQCDAQGRGPTFIDKPYPQRDYAQYLLAELQNLDAKAVIKQAIDSGKNGPQLSQALRIAQINCITEAANNYNSKCSRT